MDDEQGTKVQLKHPFKFGETREITEILIPRPKAKHIRGINFNKLGSGDADEILKLIQRLTGESTKFVDMIDLEDVLTIGEVVEDFLPNTPATGTTG